MRGGTSRPLLLLLVPAVILAAVVIPAPAAAAAVTVPYSPDPVADADLDGDPATGDWAVASWSIPLENGESGYDSATLFAKHDGTFAYFRVDGKIDVPWTSSSGTHFWFGIVFSPSGVTGHHKSGQDGVFFGDTTYASTTIPIDTYGGAKPPAKDPTQDNIGRMGSTGTSAPYDFTAEWKRKLNTGDTNDVVLLADGTTSYPFYATTDSNGGGSQGGGIDHSRVTNTNSVTFAEPPVGDTQAPTVSLTAPANNADVKGTVAIAATASDNVGVTRVEFFRDGTTLLGSDTSEPYGLSWDTTALSDGSRALTAKAYDAAGNAGTSAVVNVRVDNTPPSVTITDPPDGEVLRGTVVLTALASDSGVGVSRVEFFVDAGLLGADATAPYSQSWDSSASPEGTRTVDAKAFDGLDSVATATIQVIVDRTAPAANAGPDQTVPPGTPVTFDGSLSTDANGIAAYAWNFTDGGPQVLSGATASYTFNTAGDYPVTLTVTDPAGNAASDVMLVRVAADAFPPVARAGPDQAVLQGTLVTLDGTASTDDVAIEAYTWRFRDGEDVVLSGASVQRRFTNVGNIEVNLTVRDFTGKTDVDVMWVNVSADPVPPTADAGPDQVVDLGALAELNGSASSDNVAIANHTWVIDDATGSVTLYGEVVAHRFVNVGTFSANLTVRDYAGWEGTDALWVTVRPDAVAPTAVAGPYRSVSVIDWVTFDGSASTDDVGIVNYTWAFTDGAAVSLYGDVVVYRFRQGGNVTVTLTVRDLAGNAGTDSFWVDVSAVPVVADAGPDRIVFLGDTVTLDASNSTGNGGVVNFTWAIEGSAVRWYGQTVDFTPTSLGSLRIVLTIVDRADLSATDDVVLTVQERDLVAPARPAGASAAAGALGAVEVTWSPSPDLDVAGYLVFRAESVGGPFIQLNLVPVVGTSFADEGLVPGRTYYYVVKAVDEAGNASPGTDPVAVAAGRGPPEPFDWGALRWILAPGIAGATMAVLALLSWREDRRRRRRLEARSAPPETPKEGSP